MSRRILCVVGARPNFMKMAPLLAAFRRSSEPFECILVHTGQHYDASMSSAFFDELGLPEPDIDLGVGSGSPATQTGRIMEGLEAVVADQTPDLVLVVGDVNSTLAAALVAAKAAVPLAHVEAGLRSFDRTMPEEVNRVVTDSLASYLFATEESGVANLKREGAPQDRVFLVGNVMIDTLRSLLPRIRRRAMASQLGLAPGRFGVVTLHRPSNVDDPIVLRRWSEALVEIGTELPLVFPIHPRTAERLRQASLDRKLEDGGIRLTGPLPYVEFVSLVADSRLVLTDSGGIQEETTVLGVPCFTLRDSTERPVTVSHGTNRLVGADPQGAVAAVREALRSAPTTHPSPPLWDGQAAERIAECLRGLQWHIPGVASSRPALTPSQAAGPSD